MLRALLDFILPRQCRMCGKRLSVTEEEICGVCNWHLPRTRFTDFYDNEMARLFWGKFPVEKALAFTFYSPHTDPSKLIYDLKYHNSDQLGEFLGRLVAHEYKDKGFFDDIDAIVPVPLTFRRRLKRGYNQSEEIAFGVADVTGLAVLRNVVKRVRFTQSQTHLNSMQRTQNVEGVFKLIKPDKIKGKHILIIDDIITTGATVSSCAEELCKAGEVKISILSLGFTK